MKYTITSEKHDGKTYDDDVDGFIIWLHEIYLREPEVLLLLTVEASSMLMHGWEVPIYYTPFPDGEKITLKEGDEFEYIGEGKFKFNGT